jgi:F0F1-type ATP synthase epsilon subunit
MKIFIVTPENFYEIPNVKELLLTAKDGQITILPYHINLVTSMVAGVVNCTSEYEIKYFVGDAMIMVENNEVKIITDYCVDIAKIQDLEKYKASLKTSYYDALEILFDNKNERAIN